MVAHRARVASNVGKSRVFDDNEIVIFRELLQLKHELQAASGYQVIGGFCGFPLDLLEW